MGHVISIWAEPVPQSVEEAEAILDRLIAERARAQNSKLGGLARALWKLYPRDIANAPDDPVWADTQLSQPFDGSAVLQFAISTNYIAEVLPMVTKATMANGLVTYDIQTGSVYLPDGKVLGTLVTTSSADSAKESEPLRKAEAGRLFRDTLKQALKPTGFVWKTAADYSLGGYFCLAFEGGEHQFDFRFLEVFGGFTVDRPGCSSNLHQIDAALHQCGAERFLSPRSLTQALYVKDVVFHHMPEMKDDLPTRDGGVSYLVPPSGAAVEAFARNLAQVVDQAMVPHLRRLEHLDTYWEDALASLMAKDNTFYLPTWGVREPPRPPLQYYPVFFPVPAILAGRLMGDEHYLDLAAKIERDWVAYAASLQDKPDLATRAQAIVNDFRSQVKAITALSNSQESHPPGH